jgi:hypothetical protein
MEQAAHRKRQLFLELYDGAGQSVKRFLRAFFRGAKKQQYTPEKQEDKIKNRTAKSLMADGSVSSKNGAGRRTKAATLSYIVRQRRAKRQAFFRAAKNATAPQICPQMSKWKLDEALTAAHNCYIIPFKSCRLADCSTVPISISMLKGGGRMVNRLEVLKLALEIALIAVQIYLLLKSKKPR